MDTDRYDEAAQGSPSMLKLAKDNAGAHCLAGFDRKTVHSLTIGQMVRRPPGDLAALGVSFAARKLGEPCFEGESKLSGGQDNNSRAREDALYRFFFLVHNLVLYPTHRLDRSKKRKPEILVLVQDLFLNGSHFGVLQRSQHRSHRISAARSMTSMAGRPIGSFA